MRIFIKILLVTASIGFSQSSLAVNLRVLALGDSITESIEAPVSYRYLLQDQLNVDHTFDFLGTRSGDGTGAGGGIVANRGNPSDPSNYYDDNHQGVPDYETGDARNDSAALPSYLSNFTGNQAADVALVHLGTNDAIHNTTGSTGATVATAIGHITNIISDLKNNNPSMKIFVAQIIPVAASNIFNQGQVNSMDQFITSLNSGIAALASNDSSVYVVDMYTNFLASGGLSSDGIHPSQVGEQLLADRFFTALDASGALAAVPLPPALYLFGAAMFGLFSVGRRKEPS